MAYEARPGSGSLFKNKNKAKDTHPDYRGDVVLPDGAKMELAGWLKETKAGDKFFSLKISEPREQSAPEAPRQGPVQSVDLDDEIPF